MPNRLIDETSPYLLQHAHNPVDWFPWGDDAKARAKAEDKPILLSIGYAACHWCHVMERESFEDDAIAAQMNDGFVCVKVDREERPDLDAVYMQAVMAFTGGHGGWPMTVFLTPEGQPFLGGTYFPPVPRHGVPSFPQLMAHALRVYRERRDDLRKITTELGNQLRAWGRFPKPQDALTDRWLDALAQAAKSSFDQEVPGFSKPPRFPRAWVLSGLLAHWSRTGWAPSKAMALATLDAMAAGGMYDVVGGGFARYSVDRDWLIPHFEKMLYDNAQLAPVYLDAWLVTGDDRYARIVRETLDFVLRELRAPEGGLYSSLDADSQDETGKSEEGAFYVWTPAQLKAVLGDDAGARTAALLGVTPEGNFEHGASALRPIVPLESLLPHDRAFLDDALPELMAARSERPRPGLDDKVLTAWNAMGVTALARAGAALDVPRYVEAAVAAGEFLFTELIVDGRLHRSWKQRAHIPGFLEDHAFLISACVDLYEATFAPIWLERAQALADQTVALFWDEADGAFFRTGSDAEALIAREKPLVGSAIPSGNEVAALAFCRLDALCGRSDLGDRADQILRSLQQVLFKAATALGPALLAGAWRSGASQEIGITGAADDPAAQAMLRAVRGRHQPFQVVARVAPGDDTAQVPWMARRVDPGTPATGWVCVDRSCLLPARSVQALESRLAEVDAPSQPEPAAPVLPKAPELPSDPAAWLNADAPMTLESLRGNVVVLDFWTYCCVNCMHVLPELAAIEEAFADQPVVVIGVHSAKFTAEKEAENVAAAIARHDVKHPVVLDPDHDLWERYGVKSWPTVMILDTEGRIVWTRPGEASRMEMMVNIARYLGEAKEAGALAATPAWRPPAPDPIVAPGLRHPGKVHVYPNENAQNTGVDPWSGAPRLYISDTGNHRILEAALDRGPGGWPAARVIRVWGDGVPGTDDGTDQQHLAPGQAPARFREPQGAFRHGTTLWVADTGNHMLRSIDLGTGQTSTHVGTGELGRAAGDPNAPRELAIRSPWDVVVVDDVVLIAMAGSHQIWIYLTQRDQAGPFAGSGREEHIDGAFADAAFAQPSGLSMIGPYLFIADSEISSIRVLDVSQRQVGTIVGAGLFDFGDVDGPDRQVRLQHPLGVTAMEGRLYVADTFNDKIKSIDLETRVASTLAGGPPAPGAAPEFAEPGGIAVLGAHLIVADTNHHRLRAVDRQTGEIRDLPLSGLA